VRRAVQSPMESCQSGAGDDAVSKVNIALRIADLLGFFSGDADRFET